jgi:hypothetical protein
VSGRPSAGELLERDGAYMTRGDLRALGFDRRAADAIFRAVPVLVLPGYARPMVRAEDVRRLLEERTFDGRSKVRP